MNTITYHPCVPFPPASLPFRQFSPEMSFFLQKDFPGGQDARRLGTFLEWGLPGVGLQERWCVCDCLPSPLLPKSLLFSRRMTLFTERQGWNMVIFTIITRLFS